MDGGACGYSVVWGNGPNDWHIGYYQEAYDAECAALMRALNLAADPTTEETRAAHGFYGPQQTREVGPGQQYALQARKALERIKCPVEISVIAGNEIADGWGGTRDRPPRCEWLQHSDKSEAFPSQHPSSA